MHYGRTALIAGLVAALVAVGWAAIDRPAGDGTRSWSAVKAAPIVGDIAADTFRVIAEAQMPTVVSLQTLSARHAAGQPLPDELRRFFGLPEFGGEDRMREGAGTGFIIDRSGLILTNNHVVEGATRIQVSFFPRPDADPADVQRLDARVLGRDPITDSALLQVEGAPDLPVATLGNSDDMRPGDWVMAIGNPFALSHTVTVGVISAHARPFPVEGRVQRVLQTDAAVNPGNSGGPLINLRGEVIGINTAIVSPAGTGNIGIGFAVPINLIRELVPQLRTGDVQRGRLGVRIDRLSAPVARALGLSDERAGMEAGDVVLTYNAEPVDDADELVTLVSNTAPGTEVRVEVLRDNDRRTLVVTIGALTAAGPAPAAGGTSAAELGIRLNPLTPGAAAQLSVPPGQTGVLVTEVSPASAAADAGLEGGDVIVEVNQQRVTSVEQAIARLRGTRSGEAILVRVLRGGRDVFLTITAP
jgi:serine protease Do